jgi:hypothetical protein
MPTLSPHDLPQPDRVSGVSSEAVRTSRQPVDRFLRRIGTSCAGRVGPATDGTDGRRADEERASAVAFAADDLAELMALAVVEAKAPSAAVQIERTDRLEA